MREFSQMTATDWDQVRQGANGGVTGTLAGHPKLKETLAKCGLVLTDAATVGEVKWACEACYWQARADEFAACYNVVAEENQQLQTQLSGLKEAFKLQSEYAARPEPVPAPAMLGGPLDKPE